MYLYSFCFVQVRFGCDQGAEVTSLTRPSPSAKIRVAADFAGSIGGVLA